MNHAAVAPLSRPAAEAMCAFAQDVAQNSMAHYGEWNEMVASARSSVAGLIGARAEEIAFLKNTTDGIVAVAEGLDWRAGDNVVLASCEFPANVYPWLNLERKGVEIHWVDEHDGRLPLNAYRAAMDQRTRVVSTSAVQFHSGFRSDLAGLSEICRHHGALFVVDGIQSVGALPMDVVAQGVDFLAADGHKWMLGPEGCALFYCSANALDAIRVASLGWASVGDADFFNYDTTLHGDARRFETGTLNTVGIAGLKVAAELLLETGIEQISERILYLTDLLCEGLTKIGFDILTPRDPGEKSGIVTFTKGGIDLDAVEDRLRNRRIIATARNGCIRLSPHFYNSEEEIETVLSALAP
jgi:cysteine desulfurase/selenocysteine lyase